MKRLNRKIRSLLKNIVKLLGFNRFLFWAKTPFVSEKYFAKAEQARIALNQFSPCPQGTSVAKNTISSCDYDLQIVIPAYNVEKYIAECIDSILKQKTKYSYKIVVINDGSNDRTEEILGQYSNDPRIEIIHQENRGFSGARNRGLEKIKAKYIAFVDSDDKLAPNAIESLLNVAFAQNADIVEGGFYRLEDKLCLGYKHKKIEQVDAVRGLKGYPCGKVFRSFLFENIHFPENFWFEDSIGAFLLYPKAEKAVVIPDIVYVYRNNLTSITHTAPFKKKCIDTYWVTELLLEEQKQLNIANNDGVFEIFLKQVVLNYQRTRKIPMEVQKDVFVCTKELMTRYFERSNPKSFKALVVALQNNDFGKYACFCRNYIL